jgi:hypothetical protein
MRSTYQQALNGTLKSAPSGPEFQLSFQNHTDISISLYKASIVGMQEYFGGLSPQTIIKSAPLQQGNYIIVKSAITGGFMTVIQTGSVTDGVYHIINSELSAPHDIGPFPVPNQDIIIPTNSARVVVGCADMDKDLNPKQTVLREQYWRRLPESYTLDPHEVKTINTTVTTGREQTSSSMETVNENLSLSAGAGWGPFTAHVSASLSRTSNNSQQLVITEETTKYISSVLTNENNDYPVMILRWQLIDIIHVIEHNKFTPLYTVSVALDPILSDGPYNLEKISPHFIPPERR